MLPEPVVALLVLLLSCVAAFLLLSAQHVFCVVLVYIFAFFLYACVAFMGFFFIPPVKHFGLTLLSVKTCYINK